MKKNLYLLELSVKQYDMLGNPEPDDVDAGWSHLFGDFTDAAKFVSDIVGGYTGDWHQREITHLKLTRYIEGGLDPNRKNKKGFHQWNYSYEFKGITLKDLNDRPINEKTKKEFIKELAIFWKAEFTDIDRRIKSVIKGPGRKSK